MLNMREARQFIAKKIRWVEGAEFNHVTFRNLIREKLIPVAKPAGRNSIFVQEEIERALKDWPDKQPPSHPGLIRWLKGERPKNWKGKKK